MNPSMNLDLDSDSDFLREAIAEARLAEVSGEVPIGAVIVRYGQVIARGRNRVITDSDPTAHAEIVALRIAGRVIGNYRLEGCDLFTTLEPCSMCAGAILHARIRRLIYAATDPKAGACGSVLAVLNHPSLNHQVDVTAGVLADECGILLSTFFRTRRLSARPTHPNPSAFGGTPMATKKSAKKTAKKATHKWSAAVTTDSTHPHEGLFNKDAETIAKSLASKEVSPKGPASGMRMLNFYINRAGKNLSEERQNVLEHAKELLSELIAKAKDKGLAIKVSKNPTKAAKKAVKSTSNKRATKI